jgi:hypothetical protein
LIALVNILLGIGLLVAGRKLFWLFVAAAGFVLGAQVTIRTFNGPEWLGLIIGIVVGLLFAALAVFLRAVAIGIAGFLAGGSILLGLANMIGFDPGGFSWLVYIAGGIIGVILVAFLFDWALITLSSLGGATLIVQALNLQGFGGLAYLILVILGVVIQGGALRREKRSA